MPRHTPNPKRLKDCHRVLGVWYEPFLNPILWPPAPILRCGSDVYHTLEWTVWCWPHSAFCPLFRVSNLFFPVISFQCLNNQFLYGNLVSASPNPHKDGAGIGWLPLHRYNQMAITFSLYPHLHHKTKVSKGLQGNFCSSSFNPNYPRPVGSIVPSARKN